MNKNLCSRLQSARQCTGMSTRLIAQRLNKKGFKISHATIANYERGRTIPSLPIVAAIADVYELPINWFLQSQAALTNVSYRALKKVGMKERRQFEANAQRWLEGYRRLENKLGKNLRNKYIDFSARDKESGRKLAERLRARLKLGERPVPSTIEILHGFGVRVFTIDAPIGIDGLAAQLEKESVVVLNSERSNDRIRLNATHELGHHLYKNHDNESTVFEFASYFLIPASKLKAAFDGYSMLRLIEYKKRFGISLAAMIYRAHEEKILSGKMYKMLWREFAKRGWRKTEPGEVNTDRPIRFETMLETAIRSGKLTWAQAAKVTRINEEELRNRLTQALSIWIINKKESEENDMN